MGGAVRVIVRKEDGKVFPMTRWTNNLPYVVQNPKFFFDKEWIDDYVERRLETDYHNESFKLLQPDGYGIVVLDFVKKKILSSQGYTNFKDFNVSGLSLDKNRDEKDWSSYASASKFREMGYLEVERYTYDNKTYEKLSSVIDNNITIDEIIKKDEDRFGAIKSKFSNKSVSYNINIDYKKLGWELYDYDDDGLGLIEVFKHMYNDGFEFTKEDLDGYQEQISEKADYCETDEEVEELNNAIKRIIREDKLRGVLS